MRRRRFESGFGIGEIFTGTQFEGSAHAIAHGSGSKGDHGLQFSLGDVFHAGFKAPALAGEVELQMPPVYHRPFWLVFQIRESLDSAKL